MVAFVENFVTIGIVLSQANATSVKVCMICTCTSSFNYHCFEESYIYLYMYKSVTHNMALLVSIIDKHSLFESSVLWFCNSYILHVLCTLLQLSLLLRNVLKSMS